jgi:uncharacterized protein (TIRG00374 family)
LADSLGPVTEAQPPSGVIDGSVGSIVDSSSEQEAPQPPAIDRRKQVIAGALTLAVLVFVFVGVFPKFANYSDAWAAIKEMSVGSLLALLAVTVLNVMVYVLPYQAALPGISYAHAFVVRQTSFMISNVVPAGGAFGIGVQYAMLSGYGYGPAPTSTAIAATTLWNLLVTLALPVVGVLLLAFEGKAQVHELVGAVVGLVAVAGMVVALVVVLRSEGAARRVGGWGDAVLRKVRRSAEPDAATKGILHFRDTTKDVVFNRWKLLTVTSVAQQLCQFLILAVGFYAIAGRHSGVNPGELFAAFALARLAGFIPITPGGLGTVDAALVALIHQFGADKSVALAADLVWRAASFFPQVFIGVVTFLIWRKQSGGTRRVAPAVAAA